MKTWAAANSDVAGSAEEGKKVLHGEEGEGPGQDVGVEAVENSPVPREQSPEVLSSREDRGGG